MTVYELRRNHNRAFPNSHFFDPETLRFFGEQFAEMTVLPDTEKITDCRGNEHECYALRSWQRNNPNGPQWAIHYFDIDTFKCIIPSCTDKEI